MKTRKEFPITAWAVENRMTVYVITIAISILGMLVYARLPKEQFPDIVIPTVLVTTIQAGTSPTDIENLITRQIEKQIKSVADVKKVNSQSIQNASIIVVEFTTDIEPSTAKQRISDAVDRAKPDLPNNLTQEPEVVEVDFSEFPIMYVNIAGNAGLDELKEYADGLKDRMEALKEIRRVDLIGALEREIRVDVDPYRMQTLGITLDDVSRAISSENVNISGGEIVSDGVRRSVQISGEFRDHSDIESVVVKAGMGNTVYVRDIARVLRTHKEQQSFARLDGKPVVTLSVLKKAGENLINASDQIQQLVQEFKSTRLPQDMNITITNDTSIATRTNLADLINSIIIGFILVTIVLMFFMGVRNALFVGLATPLSSFLTFLILPGLDFTMNFVVTFAFLLALGIIVDDAIVVIENTHRLHTREGMKIKAAAKHAAADVFAPVVAGTLTTLAPFFPLLFWPGITGKFMIYLPSVLIIALSASLVVAYIMNPVFAVDFMDGKEKELTKKRALTIIAGTLVLSGLFVLSGFTAGATLLVTIVGFFFLNKYFLTPVLIRGFQEKLLPALMHAYRRTLDWALIGKRPYGVISALFGLLVLSIIVLAMFGRSPVFFPSGEPNYVYVYIKLPIGTDARFTDSLTAIVEGRVRRVVGENNPVVQTIISNVGIGAGDPVNPDRTTVPNKGKVTVAFVPMSQRGGVETKPYLDAVRDAVKDIPGAEIVVEQENFGPPRGKEVSIEISGDDYTVLSRLQESIKTTLVDSLKIPGIELLRSDLEESKPEINILVDRELANREGISTATVGMNLRNAVFGSEATKFRAGEDEYPVQVRIAEEWRDDISTLMNLPVTFREMSTGKFRRIPIASVAEYEYSSTLAGINRKNITRTITLSSNVLGGYNPNDVNDDIRKALAGFAMPDGYSVRLGGAQQDQAESTDFLAFAFMVSLMLIIIIMVAQFNSIVKPLLIMVTVLLSTIGVFLGFTIFQLQFSIVVSGVGIIALGGIVVRNGIVLVDFAEKQKALGVGIRDAIINAGIVRLNPVILTAASTILALVPLAIGFNLDFASLLTTLNPKIHIGSDSVAFWGPLAWAIIFGLAFSTFLTLIAVPCMYFIAENITASMRDRFQKRSA